MKAQKRLTAHVWVVEEYIAYLDANFSFAGLWARCSPNTSNSTSFTGEFELDDALKDIRLFPKSLAIACEIVDRLPGLIAFQTKTNLVKTDLSNYVPPK